MDVRLIIQVLVNLVDNAIKYTPSGSTITIRALKKNEKAWISVEDNGPGISDEIKPHIFEMFFTGGNNIADSQRSLGLGLALCQSIVEAHGGKMELCHASGVDDDLSGSEERADVLFCDEWGKWKGLRRPAG